ncbi:DUF2207 domain-containing protein [Cohnella fermenti]|nr:DUF2207 domain-containing protein [Cohnella fermenti]
MSLLLLLSVAPAYADDRSFEISATDIHARIDSAGDMFVTERDTYRFDGAFNGILVDLNAAGSDGIEQFEAYEVSGEDKTPLEVEQTADGDALHYKVFSESVDTTKEFELTYTVKNVVQVYADTAELYWKFFDETNANPLGSVSIEIELPAGISKDEITAFGHGPLDGNIQTTDDGTVLFRVESLPAGRMFETRVLFPPQYVPGSGKVSEEPQRDNIVEEERNWKANDEAESSNDYTVPYAVLLLIANLGAGFWIYKRYRRPPKSEWKGDYYRELPSDASPAVVSFLLDSGIESRDLMATMLDLVRRKHVVMQKLGSPKTGKGKRDYSFKRTGKSADDLLPHEAMLLEWFIGEIGDGDKVALSEIRLSASLRTEFPQKWAAWQDKIKEAALERKLLKKNSGIYRYVLLAFFIQFFGFWFAAPSDWSWLLFCAIPLPFFKPRRYQRTREGQTEYEKWKAFDRFLRAYSRIENRDAMAVHLWDHYFVYAIPLGAAKKMIKDTKVVIRSVTDRDYSAPILYQTWAVTEFDELNKQFKDAVTESHKSDSGSSSDSGGWFSSGGGGGGGGGGRGAF